MLNNYLTVVYIVKKHSAFYGAEGSLPCSQERATRPILRWWNQIQNLMPYFFTIHFNITLPSLLDAIVP
jgi:hypothetical protein